MFLHVRSCHLPNMLHSFKKQFSTYLSDGVGSEDIEEIYTSAYAAIREDPTFKPTDKAKDWRAESKKYATPRLTLEQRKARIQAKIEAFKTSGGAVAEEEEEEE
jgi:large subunit ribosomal protein L5e